jgi:hypothetical protein
MSLQQSSSRQRTTTESNVLDSLSSQLNELGTMSKDLQTVNEALKKHVRDLTAATSKRYKEIENETQSVEEEK